MTLASYQLVYYTNISLGVIHPQGAGKMQKMTCNVRFRIYIPEDLEACPYAIFLSTGIHTHPPPPPNKPPQLIMDEILDLIRRMQNPDLTLSKLTSYLLVID